MLRSICLATLLALVPTVVLADELTAEKAADVRRFIELTDGEKLPAGFAAMVAQNYYGALKAARPDTPERAMQIIQRELQPYFKQKVFEKNGYIDRMVPVYARHFTHKEIRELHAFMKGGVGKKFIDVVPQLGAETLQVRQQWSNTIGTEVRDRIEVALKREKIEVPKVAPPEAPKADPRP